MRLYKYGGIETLRYEGAVPEPLLTDNSVLIEAAATSINRVDWKLRSGARQKGFPLTLPAILGMDISGVISA